MQPINNKNSVFIATSIDGFIADENGGIDWLHFVPNPENIDMGYGEFISSIDALIMGRNTFETVCSFDIDWPYEKPVFVLTNTLKEIPDNLTGKVFLIGGELNEVLVQINAKGFHRLYIDGGKSVQGFLKEDLIDELIITVIPVLLGKGIPLFSDLDRQLQFECIRTEIFLESIVQNHFVRKR